MISVVESTSSPVQEGFPAFILLLSHEELLSFSDLFHSRDPRCNQLGACWSF